MTWLIALSIGLTADLLIALSLAYATIRPSWMTEP